jgi:hypothetical protein
VRPADFTALTFFIDRSLGSGIVADALREAGEVVTTHDVHFPPDTPDVAWLAAVGEKGWVVLTKDARIRTNQLERTWVPGSPPSCSDEATSEAQTWGAAFVTALPRMKTGLRRWRPPIIAAVSAIGGVTVHYADGEKLAAPRTVK